SKDQFDKLAPKDYSEKVVSNEDKFAREKLTKDKELIHKLLMEQIDLQTASKLPADNLRRQIIDLISEILMNERMSLNQAEQQAIATEIIDDMLGLGPLEPLLKDNLVTDIMVNGPQQIYIERKGKLELSDIKFRDEQHLYGIAQRIVNAVGRRVDESSPICDARLADGSRVNVIIPPLALKGSTISIRKFSEKKITLDVMQGQGNISENLAKVLKIAGACRLNIIISGGTGSGKTTLLNAITQFIGHGERIVTIEDAAELQLQQPHVVPLETRPANLEGKGEVTMRDLVKNALRMRPERIILGEVRGGEAIDLLQAMNTGHDGSMGTCHANSPREALTRFENMVCMAGFDLPQRAIKNMIAGSVNLIIQINRMRDGQRRVTHVTEVVGMEGDVIVTQDLFRYEFQGEDANGNLLGEFKGTGLRPNFTPKAAYYGLDKALLSAIE
ncbi:MAG: CpaF family protein, partial [Rickettsiales bacterium]